MKEMFEKKDKNRITCDICKLNLSISRRNQVAFVPKSLKFYRPKIWNTLPVNIKTAENLNAFKNLIKSWNGVSCNCIVCIHQQFIFSCYNKNIIMFTKTLIICQLFYLRIFKQAQNDLLLSLLLLVLPLLFLSVQISIAN